MFPKSFLLLGVFLLFTTAMSIGFVQAEEKEEVSDRQAAKVVAKLIGSALAGATASCLAEAGEQCKGEWRHPKAAIQCGKQFFAVNKGRCTVNK